MRSASRERDRVCPMERDDALARYLSCHAPRRRGIQYSLVSEQNYRRRRLLDRPPARTMTKQEYRTPLFYPLSWVFCLRRFGRGECGTAANEVGAFFGHHQHGGVDVSG